MSQTITGSLCAEARSKSNQDSKPLKGAADKERRFWGSGAKHSSSASLESASSAGSQIPSSAASKDPSKDPKR